MEIVAWIALGVALLDPVPHASSAASRTTCCGNLKSRRDLGFASDYVEAMRLIRQPDEPSDYVVASGVQHSV